MGLLAKHPTNSITLKPTSTPSLEKKTNGNEGLGPLNFIEFFSTVEHMRATTFWSKGGGQ
jgi:hypothetical protein